MSQCLGALVHVGQEAGGKGCMKHKVDSISRCSILWGITGMVRISVVDHLPLFRFQGGECMWHLDAEHAGGAHGPPWETW